MNVTNRKMFNRAARNKVRQMGGIMASSEPLIQEVAKFQFGGGVDILSEIRNMRPEIRSAFLQSLGNPPKRTGTRSQTVVSQQPPLFSLGRTKKDILNRDYNVFEPGNTAPTTDISNVLNMNTQELLQRQNLNRIIGKAKSLGFLEKPNVSKSEVEEFVKSETGTPFFEASNALINSLSGPSESRYEMLGKELLKGGLLPGTMAADVLKKTNEYLSETPTSTIEGILEGKVPMPAGVDIIALGANSGLSDDRLRELGVPIDQINAMKKVRGEGLGQLERKATVIDDEAQKAEEQRLKDQLAFRKQEDIIAGRTDVDPDLARIQEQLRFRDKEGKIAVAGGAPDPAQTMTEEGVKALQDQISGGRISSGTLEDGTKVQTLGVTADQGTEAKLEAESKKVLGGEGDINNVKGQVTESFKTGVGVKGAIKQFMDEFVSNAPEYKGMDKGLAIAKIGFAMAAGESPNAITNIAKALSDGADMFIADKAKRDAFNRQVQLSALQYGIGEVSKQRAQARADIRSRDTYVVGKDGVTIDGEFFEEGRTVTLNEAQVQKLGGKMKNLATLEAFKELKDIALAEYEAKFGGDPAKFSDAASQKKLFIENLEKAEDASIAISVLDQVKKIVQDPKRGLFTRGAKGAIGRMYTKGRVFLGLETGQIYNSQEEVKAKVLSTLSDVISVTIGSTQSANSISDRDVLYQVIEPYFSGIVTNVGTAEEPRFALNLKSEDLVVQQMDAAIAKLLKSQGQALGAAQNARSILYQMPRVKGFTGSGADLLSGLEGRAAVFDLAGTDYQSGDPSDLTIPTFDIVKNDQGLLDLKRFGG